MHGAPLSLDDVAAPSRRTDAALLDLLRLLKARGFGFVTPTPGTHARVLARRPDRDGADLRDIFGWSRPFGSSLIDPELFRTLTAAEALEPVGNGLFKSRYRVSQLGDDLFLHSAYPTTAQDAVFFGPDSYRFADLVRRELRHEPVRRGARLVDIGAGAGVGAMVAAKACPGLRTTMTDINPEALRLAAINARAAGIEAEYVLGAGLGETCEEVDIALANPPYLADAAGREYRDGGDMHGGRVACEMAAAALDRLAPGGRLVLYAGSAIVAGADRLRGALSALAAERGCTLRYREIDPDVFGEELDKPAYRDVERIALAAAVISRPQASPVR